MKKYIFSFLAVALFAFTSCENDEIEVKSVGSIDISINTGELYTDLSVSNGVKNLLGKNSNWNIGVMLLLYDNNGNLIEKSLSTTNTYQTLQASFSDMTSDKKYTIVAIQTLVDTDENNEAIFWDVKEENKLSTLRLDTNSDQIYWYGAAGVAVKTFTTSEDNTKIALVPEPIGAIVDFGYENFSGSNLVRLGFQLKNVVDGIYLDPNHVGDKLYYEDYNPSGTWGHRGYFLNDAGLADEDSKDLFIIDMGQQFYCFGVSTSDQWKDYKFTAYPSTNSSFTFEPGKYYTAYCIYDANTKNLLTYMGLSTGFQSWYNQQQYQAAVLFEEPYINWGGTVSAVKSAMSAYEVGNDTPEYVDGLQAYVIWYYGKYSEDEIDYYFSTSTSGLFRVYVFADAETVGEDQLSALFTSMDYVFVTSNDSEALWRTKDGNAYIQYGMNTQGYWYICYYDPTNSLNGSSSRRQVKSHNSVSNRPVINDMSTLANTLQECEAAISKKNK